MWWYDGGPHGGSHRIIGNLELTVSLVAERTFAARRVAAYDRDYIARNVSWLSVVIKLFSVREWSSTDGHPRLQTFSLLADRGVGISPKMMSRQSTQHDKQSVCLQDSDNRNCSPANLLVTRSCFKVSLHSGLFWSYRDNRTELLRLLYDARFLDLHESLCERSSHCPIR